MHNPSQEETMTMTLNGKPYIPSKRELRGPAHLSDLAGVIGELVQSDRDATLFLTTIEEPGAHIPTVLAKCENMLAVMQQMFGWESKLNVRANDIDVEVRLTRDEAARIINHRPSPAVTKWESRFHELCEERSREYRETDAYKQAEAVRVKLAQLDQVQIDRLIQIFPADGYESDLLQWIGDFAAINDNNRLHFDHEFVAKLLIAEGYVRNDSVLTREQIDAGEQLPESLHGRWLIGQAIDHLMRGMPIHPAIGERAAALTTRQVTY